MAGMTDETDRRVLRALQRRPEGTTAELAALAGVAPSTFWRRVERLRARKVIRGFRRRVNWRALGWGVEVSLRFSLDKTSPGSIDRFLAAAREIPEVVEIATYLGRVDARLHVIARDMLHYKEIYHQRLLALPHVAEIEALMVVAEVERAQVLPI